MSKLSDAEAEAAEVQTWLEFAVKCRYLSEEDGRTLHQEYDGLLGRLVAMIFRPDPWLVRKNR